MKTYGIVISSYKYGHLAAHCIESILSQSRPYDKIWFVDDAAGDCEHLVSMYPDVNFTLRTENMGTVANFDDMLRKVDTDMCMFIGADNWLRGDALEILSQYDADIIMYDMILTGTLKLQRIKAHVNEIQDFKYFGDFRWSREGKHHGSMMYNTKMAQECGYGVFNHPNYPAEDFGLWNCLLANEASHVHVPEPLLYYRTHKNNYHYYGEREAIIP